MNANPTIQAHVASVKASFQDLQARLEEGPPPWNLEDQISLPIVQDEYGRFKVWAGNIGAWQKGTAGLDHRLREAGQIRQAILKILKDLSYVLGELHDIVSGSRAPRDSESTISSSGSLIFSEGSSADGEDDYPESPQDALPISEVRELLRAVVECIGSLFKLSMLIRSAASDRDRYDKASKIGNLKDSFDIAHTYEKFPYARNKEWLIRKLGKANAKRRQYLLYRRRHHDKLARDPDEKQERDDRTEVPKYADVLQMPVQQQDYLNVELKSRGATTILAPSTFAQTTASTFVPNNVQRAVDEVSDSGISQTSYATSVSEDETSQLCIPPQPSPLLEGGDEVECHYCWTVQSIKGSTGWKRHVFHDLEPYICTFQDCSAKPFSSRHAWFNHELEYHRVEWVCYLCSHVSATADGMKSHFRTKHTWKFTEAQLPAVVKKCERPLEKIPVDDCPLCDTWAKKIRETQERMDPESISRGETIVVTPKQFRNHLARHLEQLALFVLPRGVDDDDDGQDGEGKSDIDSVSLNNRNSNVTTRSTRSAESIQSLRRSPAGSGIPSPSTDRSIHSAALRGDLEAVLDLLEGGSPIDARDGNHNTPLHLAVSKGHKEVCTLLLSRGADTRKVDKHGYRPLDLARIGRFDEIFEMLREAGGDEGEVITIENEAIEADKTEISQAHERPKLQRPDHKNEDALASQIHELATGGISRLVKNLLDRGVPVDIPDKNRNTPLHLATMYGHRGLCKLLLDYGADVRKRNMDGFTPLDYASTYGYTVIETLLKGASQQRPSGMGFQQSTLQYADVASAVEHCDYEGVRDLLNQGHSANSRNAHGETPLHIAAETDDANIAVLLLSWGADPFAKNKNGQMPWQLALNTHPNTRGSLDVLRQASLHSAVRAGEYNLVKELLDAGASADSIDGFDRDTALHHAVGIGHERLCRLLLERGADPHKKNKRGNSPLDYAHATGMRKIVDILKEAVSNAKKASNDEVHEVKGPQETIHSAVIRGDLNAVQSLLDQGVPVDSTGDSRCTPLHFAARYGHEDICKLLVSCGADFELRDKSGFSPLDIATEKGYESIISIFEEARRKQSEYQLLQDAISNKQMKDVLQLIRTGISVNCHSRHGYTPLHYAASMGDVEMCKLLLEHGAEKSFKTDQGLTASDIARDRGYNALLEVLESWGSSALDAKSSGEVQASKESIGEDFDYLTKQLQQLHSGLERDDPRAASFETKDDNAHEAVEPEESTARVENIDDEDEDEDEDGAVRSGGTVEEYAEDLFSLLDNAVTLSRPEQQIIIDTLPRLTHDQVTHLAAIYMRLSRGVSLEQRLWTLLPSGRFREAVWACAAGHWASEAKWATFYFQSGIGSNGPGSSGTGGGGPTNLRLLMEAVLQPPNYVAALKKNFEAPRFSNDLKRAITWELKYDTFRSLLVTALEVEKRMSEDDDVFPDAVARDVARLFEGLGDGKNRRGESVLADIAIRSNERHLRKVCEQYSVMYGAEVLDIVRHNFKGNLGDALTYLLESALNKPLRDAKLIYDALEASPDVKERLLTSRLVRAHWDREHLESIKQTYAEAYGRPLVGRLSSILRGPWRDFLVEMCL